MLFGLPRGQQGRNGKVAVTATPQLVIVDKGPTRRNESDRHLRRRQSRNHIPVRRHRIAVDKLLQRKLDALLRGLSALASALSLPHGKEDAIHQSGQLIRIQS
jgi:hypothetical protein